MMKQFLKYAIIAAFIVFLLPQRAHSVSLTHDPQYIVMNFASINELNWASPEDQWRKEIKPQIVSQIRELKAVLPSGSPNRKLAWSTLQEYMNTPLDSPSEQSVYAIKMRRILDITEEENIPVFLPLNGFQWWDELPELYNWWDPDGTNTPENFFARQRTKDFKERFIKGYNPENKWNVEWQDPLTPMKLNWRNWGSGGFRLAPPPNLVRHEKTAQTYRSVLEGRLRVMLAELQKRLILWEQEEKLYLFAGISIGTEISLNASVTPADEFIPYGYRGVQDTHCLLDNPTCLLGHPFSAREMDDARAAVVRYYLQDLTFLASTYGIPKLRIYTHVWSEALPGEPRYSNYADAAFTLYSRPGMSFYGHAQNPLSQPLWSKALAKNGFPSWAAPEFTTDKLYSTWMRGLTNSLDSETPAKILDIYNWQEHKGTAAIAAISAILQTEPVRSKCSVPEILPRSQNRQYDPEELAWGYFDEASPSAQTIEELQLHIVDGVNVASASTGTTVSLSIDSENYAVSSISAGISTWFIEAEGCSGKNRQFSEPRIIVVPANISRDIPLWVRQVLFFQDIVRSLIGK